jgi:Tfp pilus assembly protein PilE
MYDYVASVFRIFDMAAQASGEQDKQGLFASQVTAFEKENKFRIKEDLLNALGNEIAVCLPADFLGVRRAGAVAATEGDEKSGETRAVQSSPVVVISLNDKKAVQDLLPRALEALGAKGVSEQMLIEKRGDVEMLTFSNGCAAFIDRYLVVALDPATMRWVVDAYNKRETLANDEEFRRAVSWQPRAALGQVYVSNALLKETFADTRNSVEDIEDHELRNFISRLDPNPGAITHVVTREGDGLLHELHVPKNLLALLSASAVVAEKTAPIRAKESAATSALYSIAGAQEKFKEENGRYATQSELEAELKSERGEGNRGSAFKVSDYEIKLNVSGDEFSVTATPTSYPKQGRRSFYIDQTMTMRGGDTGGKTATASSKPIIN